MGSNCRRTLDQARDLSKVSTSSLLSKTSCPTIDESPGRSPVIAIRKTIHILSSRSSTYIRVNKSMKVRNKSRDEYNSTPIWQTPILSSTIIIALPSKHWCKQRRRRSPATKGARSAEGALRSFF